MQGSARNETATSPTVEAHDGLEKNGGDDVDDDGPVEPNPSRREALLGSLFRPVRKTEARSRKNTGFD